MCVDSAWTRTPLGAGHALWHVPGGAPQARSRRASRAARRGESRWGHQTAKRRTRHEQLPVRIKILGGSGLVPDPLFFAQVRSCCSDLGDVQARKTISTVPLRAILARRRGPLPHPALGDGDGIAYPYDIMEPSNRATAGEVYALVVEGSVDIQGLVAVADDEDARALRVAWMCTSPENNNLLVDEPRYTGVGGHLFEVAA